MMSYRFIDKEGNTKFRDELTDIKNYMNEEGLKFLYVDQFENNEFLCTFLLN